MEFPFVAQLIKYKLSYKRQELRRITLYISLTEHFQHLQKLEQMNIEQHC